MKHPFSRLFGLGEKTSEAEVEESLAAEQEEFSGNEEVLQIPIGEIVPNRYQPRTVFIDERIEELSQTIKTHGIIQPIVVRRSNGQYEIIAGERRYRAVQKLGWHSIPAIVKEFNESQTASIALIENLQREELSAIEEATAYAKLIEIHGLTQESLAQRLGKGQSTIANKLRLLKLPDAVQHALLNKEITERHARALISLKIPEKQEKILVEIKERNLNVKQTEERIKQLLESGDTEKKRRMKPKRKSVSKDTRLALNTIRQSIDMVHQTGLAIDTAEEDHTDYYQITIKIPKK
ncbi:nucleoid occlusion protein [Pseudalkalibacillus salsuginis]|uniref:nucleoid occlusion protein n=1 Tax=Pseudalkalibacillus salsuginis TaxID=2910972 RepID=UPI001F231CC9|nr:nucleoid occlusion protein [Pseudalkalibacillus salsuginis]MCF6410716.1 nucleoid occlusion protein [Pseudalkalibacillus salsuginis]